MQTGTCHHGTFDAVKWKTPCYVNEKAPELSKNAPKPYNYLYRRFQAFQSSSNICLFSVPKQQQHGRINNRNSACIQWQVCKRRSALLTVSITMIVLRK
jgi:hypothetical protein